MHPIVRLTRVEDAAIEPVSLASMKGWLKVEHAADDDLIAELITAARLVCEDKVRRSFITTTWRYSIDRTAWSHHHAGEYLIGGQRFGWDRPAIQLPVAPVLAISDFKYVRYDGTLEDVDLSEIEVLAGTPGYFRSPVSDWPFMSLPTRTGLRATLTAGYGPTPGDVPRNLVLAIRMLTAHFYEHRSSQAEMPDAVANLLGPARWDGYA